MPITTKHQSKKSPKKRRFKGIIISDKMDQTVVVKVTIVKRHKLYKKRYRIFKRYLAHNPDNKFKSGDKVIIEECRPISKKKRWRVTKKI